MGSNVRLNQVRVVLRAAPDGMTVAEIAHTGRILKAMPDSYIDRWDGPSRGQWRAIWCVVVPPEDCPKPVTKKTK
jgi:hypothetical protein